MRSVGLTSAPPASPGDGCRGGPRECRHRRQEAARLNEPHRTRRPEGRRRTWDAGHLTPSGLGPPCLRPEMTSGTADLRDVVDLTCAGHCALRSGFPSQPVRQAPQVHGMRALPASPWRGGRLLAGGGVDTTMPCARSHSAVKAGRPGKQTCQSSVTVETDGSRPLTSPCNNTRGPQAADGHEKPRRFLREFKIVEVSVTRESQALGGAAGTSPRLSPRQEDGCFVLFL